MGRTIFALWCGLWLAASASAAEQAGAALRVEGVATPVKTARMWATALSPNPRGGYNFIAQFMNYKYTTGWQFERVRLDGGREYVAFKDRQGRPDAEWVIVDLEKGEGRVVELPGFHGGASCRAENGRIFFPVDFFQVWYYEPREETVKILGQLAEWKPYTNDRSIYRIMLGPDGMVYATTQAYNGCTTLVRINPDTLEYKLFSTIGTGKQQGLSYGYYLGVDPPWAYVAVGQSRWELFAVNMETGERRCLAEREGPGSRIVVSQGQTVSVQISGGEGMRAWCVDGALAPMQASTPPPLHEKAYRQVEWKQTQPLPMGNPPEVDMNRLAVDEKGEGQVWWRPAGSTGEWKAGRFRIRHAEGTPIESLTLLPDGSLFGGVAQYQGFFRYYPDGGKLDYFGKHGPSGAVPALVDGKVYFFGYPNVNLWVYDPAKPWTSRGKADANDKDSNPAFIGYFGQGCTEAHHSRSLAAGENGRLYLCGKRERWSTGTGLGYYEPATGRKFGLPRDMLDLGPRGMVVMSKLGRVVVSGEVLGEGTAAEAQLRVYDMDLKEVERLTVRPGLKDTGALYPTADAARIVGVVGSKGGPALYLYDLEKKALVKWVDLDEPVRGSLFRAPDGSSWLLKGANLCLLAPETLEVKPVSRLERGMSFCHWVGKDLYGVDGADVLRVRDALPGK